MPQSNRPRWLREAVVGAGIGLALALALSVQAAAQPPPAPSSTPSGDLSITAQDATRIAGDYGLAGSLVSYDARRSGDEVTVDVTVNGNRLHAELDLATRTGSWTGYGAMLGADGKIVLSGLERELAAEIGAVDALRPHEDLLYRAIMYWAEAPAGAVLTGSTLEAPVERTGERTHPLAGTVRPDGTIDRAPSEEPCLDPVTGEVDPAACQVDDDNGIAYLPGHVCNGGTALECHDASSHCFTCSSTNAGKPYDCKGRCGGGCCIPDGLGIFTYDCLDHDECCRVHGGCFNPWDGNCGDEYFDADDDFLWGTSNCGWVC